MEKKNTGAEGRMDLEGGHGEEEGKKSCQCEVTKIEDTVKLPDRCSICLAVPAVCLHWAPQANHSNELPLNFSGVHSGL